MNTKLTFIILIVISFFGCSNLLTLPPLKELPDNSEHIEQTVRDSVSAYIKNVHKGTYIPYNFSPVTVHKPQEFNELDTLYLERINITRQKNKLKGDYDSLLNAVNQKIALKKQEINRKKLYHSYEVEHIFIIQNDNDNNHLHNNIYTLYPNFTVKDIDSEMHTQLSDDEVLLFDIYSKRKPLFETYYGDNSDLNSAFYDKFDLALQNDTVHKDRLVHSILYIVKYIRANNEFNQQEIMEELGKRWLYKNNINLQKPVFSSYKALKKATYLVGYSLPVTDSQTSQSYEVLFDLNLVPEKIIIVK